MSFEVKTTSDFDKSAKSLVKKYRSFKADLRDLIASLEENPEQGTELSPGIRKLRMAITSKGRGKAGGARVITFTIVVSENTGRVYLMDLYDKADYSTVDVRIIQKRLKDLGFLQ